MSEIIKYDQAVFDVAEPVFPAMATKSDKIPSFPRTIVSPKSDTLPVMDRGIVCAEGEHGIFLLAN